jgi:quercetin dioxygenase-like cupin family protein
MMDAEEPTWTVARGNDRQWIETRGGRTVTVTEHPVRPERVEFLNEPDDPMTGPLTLKFYLEPGSTVEEHAHPEQTETFTVNNGRMRAVIDGEERIVERGDHEQIPDGVPHGYEVVGEEPVVLSMTMTPALHFKEFLIAEHGLTADDYPQNGLNLPYLSLVTKCYGPAIAPPSQSALTRVLGAVLVLVAQIRGFHIPDQPLPVRGEDESEED